MCYYGEKKKAIETHIKARSTTVRAESKTFSFSSSSFINVFITLMVSAIP